MLLLFSYIKIIQPRVELHLSENVDLTIMTLCSDRSFIEVSMTLFS